jgi:hypothetical protein
VISTGNRLRRTAAKRSEGSGRGAAPHGEELNLTHKLGNSYTVPCGGIYRKVKKVEEVEEVEEIF